MHPLFFSPLALVLLAAPDLLPGAGTEPVALRFAPAEGTSWTKSIEGLGTMEWQEFQVIMNGQPVPAEYLPEIEMEVTNEQRLVVTDHYLAMARGRPQQLRRTYDVVETSISQDLNMTDPMGGNDMSETSSGDGESVLAGRTVEFTWDADAEEYTTGWHGEGAAESVPEGIVEDMDLRALLPGEEVAVGAEWTVRGGALAALIEPGGDLDLVWPEDLGPELNKKPRDKTVEGELTLKLESVEDGIARVLITGEATEVRTLEGDLSQVPVAEGDATQVDTTVFELQGSFAWHLDLGLLQSLELEYEVDLESVTSADDPAVDYEHTIFMSGSGTMALTCEPKG